MKEDRDLYARIIKIAQNRPELITKMEGMVSNYEMSVIPRANFAPDGSPLITRDKANLVKHILDLKPIQGEPAQADDKTQVLVIDAMPEVHNLKKRATTTKLSHLKRDFNHRINRKAAKGNYTEIYVTFNEWWSESLKDNCRSNREESAPSGLQSAKGYDMHDEMCIRKTLIAELLASRESKSQIAHYLAHGLLEEYEGKDVKLVVTCRGKILINRPHLLPPGFTTHCHEEADTQIPLVINFSLSEDKYKHFDVYSPDTDVLVELIDLVSNGVSGALTSTTLYAGNERYPKKIDVMNRVRCLGKRKSQALLGFHLFSGEDHGNKFVGITKNTWCKLFFALPNGSPIIDSFIKLGCLTSEQCSSLNEIIEPLAQFTCMGYDSDGPHSIPELRWKLWSKKNKEGENLPPTVSTLISLLQRTNLVGRVCKAYTSPNPIFPALTECGWVRDPETNILSPNYCLLPPAPEDVLEFVKCGCTTTCSKNICSCYKAGVPCTPLCKCSDDECLNV